MTSRILHAVAGAAAIVGIAPATASADKVVRAEVVWRFDAASYTMDQGELLSFHNADSVSPGPHNVTASDNGADGKPLFASESVGNGADAVVTGARRLKTGSYPFICTVHPFMQATLMVTDKGTPEGAPAAPAPPTSPSPAATADTRPPALKASIASTTLRRALRARRFSVAVTSDEAATLRVRLTARLRGRTVLLGAVKARAASAGRRVAIAVGLTRAGTRALRGATRAKLTLAVEGRDGAGNVGTATAGRTLRR